MRFLGANFVDPSQLDASKHWSIVQNNGNGENVNADYAINSNNNGVMQIGEKRTVKELGAGRLTTNIETNIGYDFTRLVPTSVERVRHPTDGRRNQRKLDNDLSDDAQSRDRHDGEAMMRRMRRNVSTAAVLVGLSAFRLPAGAVAQQGELVYNFSYSARQDITARDSANPVEDVGETTPGGQPMAGQALTGAMDNGISHYGGTLTDKGTITVDIVKKTARRRDGRDDQRAG